MVILVKITFNDDKDASTNVEAMPCSSINEAKYIILGELNKDFSSNWTSLKDAAKELNGDLDSCICSPDEKDFLWMDNGKGVNYLLGRVNERDMNTKYFPMG